jgi:hypothetical protein
MNSWCYKSRIGLQQSGNTSRHEYIATVKTGIDLRYAPELVERKNTHAKKKPGELSPLRNGLKLENKIRNFKFTCQCAGGLALEWERVLWSSAAWNEQCEQRPSEKAGLTVKE